MFPLLHYLSKPANTTACPTTTVSAAPAPLEAGEDLASAELVTSLQAQLAHTTSLLEAQKAVVSNARAVLEVEQKVLAATVEVCRCKRGIAGLACHIMGLLRAGA
jgi:hypothetical protein